MKTDAEFGEWATAATPGLLRLAMSLTGDAHDARDLVQDTFVRLMGAWERVDHSLSPFAYASRTMVRLNLNRLRNLRREVALLKRVQDHGLEDLEPHAVTASWLSERMARLPPRQRTAVSLVHVWDYSIVDAAELMNCRPNTVKTHLARAMATLRSAGNQSTTPPQEQEVTTR